MVYRKRLDLLQAGTFPRKVEVFFFLFFLGFSYVYESLFLFSFAVVGIQ